MDQPEDGAEFDDAELDDTEFDDKAGADDEDDDFEDEDDDLFAVTPQPRTICHLCGGAGFVANPVLAIIGGTPRTVDNGRECPHCAGARTFPGMVPPL